MTTYFTPDHYSAWPFFAIRASDDRRFWNLYCGVDGFPSLAVPYKCVTDDFGNLREVQQ